MIAQQAAERDARPKALDWGWLKVEKGSIADRLFGLSKDDEPVATLNDRIKADMADHSEKQGGALPPPPVQKIDLGAQRVDVNVHVEGGGTATANVTQTQAPSVSSDGGLAVGRN